MQNHHTNSHLWSRCRFPINGACKPFVSRSEKNGHSGWHLYWSHAQSMSNTVCFFPAHVTMFLLSWRFGDNEQDEPTRTPAGVLISHQPKRNVSHEKNLLTSHCTGCLIGILIKVYYDPYITG